MPENPSCLSMFIPPVVTVDSILAPMLFLMSRTRLIRPVVASALKVMLPESLSYCVKVTSTPPVVVVASTLTEFVTVGLFQESLTPPVVVLMEKSPVTMASCAKLASAPPVVAWRLVEFRITPA